MHRQIYRAALAVGLACALAGCGSKGQTGGHSAASTAAEAAASSPAETQAAPQDGETAAESGTSADIATAAAGTESADQFGGVVSSANLTVNNAGLSIDNGRVCVLNADPRADAALQTLATLYNSELGGNVTVVTVSNGDYNADLKEFLRQDEYPTIFNIGSETDAAKWSDYLYDLSGSDIASHVADPSLSVTYDGKTAAVPASVHVYGIVCNRTILNAYCQMNGALISSPDDIQSLAALSAVADDIFRS